MQCCSLADSGSCRRWQVRGRSGSLSPCWRCSSGASPDLLLAPLLWRFVVLTAATIASNLLPFGGLDGSWIFADLVREPDLNHRCRSAVTEFVTNILDGHGATRDDVVLASYGALNRVVEWALLATSCFFWYQLFADTFTGVEHRGPIGWAGLCALGLVLGYGAASDAVSKLQRVYAETRAWVQRIRFRLQWRWRISAVQALAERIPSLALLDDTQLSTLAGYLVRFRRADSQPTTFHIEHRRRMVGLPEALLERVLTQV